MGFRGVVVREKDSQIQVQHKSDRMNASYPIRIWNVVIVCLVGVGILGMSCRNRDPRNELFFVVNCPTERAIAAVSWDTGSVELKGEVEIPKGVDLALLFPRDHTGKLQAGDLEILELFDPEYVVSLYIIAVPPGIQKQDMPHIGRLAGLHKLELYGGGLSDQTTMYLSGLHELESLWIGNCGKITDGTFFHSLKSLKELTVWVCPVSESALLELGKVSTLEKLSLDKLWKTGVQVSEKTIAELQRMLPNCVIECK